MIRGNSIVITFTIVATELLTCWFVRADCSTADEPGQVPQIGGLSNFGKVSTKNKKYSCVRCMLQILRICEDRSNKSILHE